MMLIFVTVLILNVWAISADDVFSSNINILEELKEMKTELGKIKTMETKIKSMEIEMERLRTENKETVKVAFSTTLSALENGYKFIGPHSDGVALVYENVLTNIGNAYDTYTGIFTAPVKGVYYFNFVLFNPHEMPTGVNLVKNGKLVVAATDNPPSIDTEDTASNAVSLLLEAGDRINIVLWANRRVYTDGNRRNTFSGHLLFTM